MLFISPLFHTQPALFTMANRMCTFDSDLQKCYEYDLDWSLLPIKLREVNSIIFLQFPPSLPKQPTF